MEEEEWVLVKEWTAKVLPDKTVPKSMEIMSTRWRKFSQ